MAGQTHRPSRSQQYIPPLVPLDYCSLRSYSYAKTYWNYLCLMFKTNGNEPKYWLPILLIIIRAVLR